MAPTDPTPTNPATANPTASSPGNDPSLQPRATHMWTGKRGAYDQVLAAGDGTLLVIWDQWTKGWTLFRLYSAELQPVTPLLRIESAVDTAVGTPNGFLVHSTVSFDGNATYEFDGWSEITTSGAIRTVAVTTTPQYTRRSDILVDEQRAYRPSSRTIFPFPKPAGPAGRRTWRFDDAGRIWSCPQGGITGDLVWSRDGGRSWRRTPLTLSTDRRGRLSLSCLVRDGHLVLVGIDEEAAFGVAALPWPSDRALTAYPTLLDEHFNPWEYALLQGGRMAFGTDTNGLRIATDASNKTFQLQPGPVSPNGGWHLTGSSIVSRRGGGPFLSTDDGLTWRRLDLEGASWSSGE